MENLELTLDILIVIGLLIMSIHIGGMRIVKPYKLKITYPLTAILFLSITLTLLFINK